MKAIIMAAGQSTRTHPLTLTRPKPLLRVMDKTIIEHQLDALTGVVDTAIIIVGYMKEMIMDAMGDSYGAITIKYVEQKKQLGTGHAVLQCADLIEEPFIAINGDDLYDSNDLSKLALESNAVLVKPVDNPSIYGIIEANSDGKVMSLVEKPSEPVSNLASVGAYKFTPEIFNILENTDRSERSEIEITSAIQILIEKGDFRAVEMEGYWLPVAYPWHLLEANEYFLNTKLKNEIHGDVNPAAQINGDVYIGEGAVIMPGVLIDGPVYIDDNCIIGPNCWLRPYTTLGKGCRVGQASETKNVVFFDGAAAPHQNYIGDSVIGEKVNLGCGTVTANLRHDNANVKSMVKGELVDTGRRKCGTFIGDHVHTGIHTDILPGRKLWPNTITQPGQVVRRDIEE